MTAAQLQRLLDKIGETQVGMARKLEISDRTMRRYIASKLAVPKVVELAVLYVAKHPENV